MKWIAIYVMILLSILAALPANGEMTEYQKGVANGLKIGLFMGEYYGRGQYALDYAGEFNSYLDQYNQFLWTSFGDNQTLLREYVRLPIALKTRSASSGGLKPDASGRILGYPADSYYTWIGAVPGPVLQNPYDALPGA
jgi:hypothetical protein